jgi:hypothetical protein
VRRIDGDDAFARERRRGVDVPNAGVRKRAAQECRMQHPRQLDVVDEQRLAGEQTPVLVALDRRAEIAGRHSSAPHSVGWAKAPDVRGGLREVSSAVPTTAPRDVHDGGHGARERAFAHPTRKAVYPSSCARRKLAIMETRSRYS